jgi:hypothetical protein
VRASEFDVFWVGLLTGPSLLLLWAGSVLTRVVLRLFIVCVCVFFFEKLAANLVTLSISYQNQNLIN